MLQLRPYQDEALTAIEAAEARGIRRQLLALPTGTGKTVIFADLLRRREGRALVLAHRDELIEQAIGKLKLAGMTQVGLVKAESDQHHYPVVVASVQTLSRENRLAGLQPDFRTVIVDEAHHAPAETYKRVLEYVRAFEAEGPLVLGVTATAERADGTALGDVFQEVVFERGLLEMIRSQYLCDLPAWPPPRPARRPCHRTAGHHRGWPHHRRAPHHVRADASREGGLARGRGHRLAQRLRAVVVLDVWQSALMSARLRADRIETVEFAFTQPSRAKLYSRLLDVVRQGQLRSHPHEELERELLGLEIHPTGSGFRVDHAGSGFDDHVVAVGLAISGLAAIQVVDTTEIPEVERQQLRSLERYLGVAPTPPGGWDNLVYDEDLGMFMDDPNYPDPHRPPGADMIDTGR